MKVPHIMKNQTENITHESNVNYTSSARPTIIYAGLLFVFFEVSGFRWILLIKIDACKEVIEYSQFIFINFLTAWGLFAGVYNIARTAEKHGVKPKILGSFVPSIPQNDNNYTKKARPTVIYVGLLYIFFEIIGARWFLPNLLGIDFSTTALLAKKELLLNSTKDIIQYFLSVWTMLVAEYGGCRTFEKYKMPDKINEKNDGKANIVKEEKDNI